MLVHDENANFPYKDPFFRVIKATFDAMLRNRAGCNQLTRPLDAPP
jgi:hypothetical protein